MDELIKIVTPQNFAMVICIYLLIRFEKALLTLSDKVEEKIDQVEKTIAKNNKLLALIIFKCIPNSSITQDFKEFLCPPEKEDLKKNASLVD